MKNELTIFLYLDQKREHFSFLKNVSIAINQAQTTYPVEQPMRLTINNPYDFAISLDTVQWRIRATVYERGWEVASVPLDIPVTTVLEPRSQQQIDVPALPGPRSVWDKPHTSLSFSLAGKEEPYPVNSAIILMTND